MTVDELYNYLVEKNLESDILDVLLFNKLGISFIPIKKPAIIYDSDTHCYFGIEETGYNILSTDYFNVVLEAQSLYEAMPNFFHHQQHLIGYIMKYNNMICLVILYYKGINKMTVIRNDAIQMFLSILDEHDISLNPASLDNLINEAKNIRNSYQKIHHLPEKITDINLFFDDSIKKHLSKEKLLYTRLEKLYRDRLLDIQDDVSWGRSVLSNISTYASKLGSNTTKVELYATLVKPDTIHTDLNKTSIIDKRDNIPNILLELAIRLNANKLYIATGYLFDSGLKKLEPTLNVICNKSGEIEFTVGALKNSKAHKGSINRTTASLINEYIDSGRINKLFTNPEQFYHGKFYYIANDEEAYVIVGSSNVTSSAFYNNYELDLIDRITNVKNSQYISWYENFRNQLTDIEKLNINDYENNLFSDEAHHSKSEGIYRKLTTDEQKERLKILESFNPTQVFDNWINDSIGFKPFKNYYIYEYKDKSLYVLESFEFGNACYILSGNCIDDIKESIKGKSKQNVQESDIYVTHIEHGMDFNNIISEILI